MPLKKVSASSNLNQWFVFTMVQNNKESGCKYWAIRSFVRSLHSRAPLPSFVRLLSRFAHSFLRSWKRCCTVVWNKQELGRKYWATRSSVRWFARPARPAHSFACSALLALLARSAALTCLLARSLRSLPRSWDSE